MGKPDIVYECHEADTSYRIEPNTDAAPGDGFRHGATLSFRDDGDWVAEASFFIAPEAMEAVGLALVQAAKDAKQDTTP